MGHRGSPASPPAGGGAGGDGGGDGVRSMTTASLHTYERCDDSIRSDPKSKTGAGHRPSHGGNIVDCKYNGTLVTDVVQRG
jgi:hypothetical protein